VVTLLRDERLPRNEAHQVILRTGLDRLQLSGAVVLANEGPGGVYRLKNEIYRQVLRAHFVQGRVARVLRMSGRWDEAIRYLSAELEREHDDAVNVEESRTSLLEAIIQAIYAADREEDAYKALLEGIHRGFHRSGVRIYRAYPEWGELRLVESDEEERPARTGAHGGGLPEEANPPAAGSPPVRGGRSGGWLDAIDLNDGAQPEVRTFRNGGFTLRGEPGSRRLVVALTPERRAIGMVTIERFSAELEPHVYPPDTFPLVRFLRHASTALENVLMRSAIQEIGRAVLHASTTTSNLGRVLEIVLNATGGNAAQLLMLDGEEGRFLRLAHAGDTGALHAGSDGVIGLEQENHPAVLALRSVGPERQVTPGGLEVYLPLAAGGSRLGVLALYFAGANGISPEDRKTLETFADQVAIAVHNMQLLRRTDEALQEKVRQVEALRRQAEQDRDEVLQDVATVLVHRLGGSIGTIPTQLQAAAEALAADARAAAPTRAAVQDALDEVQKSVHRLQELLPPLEELADLASVEFHPLEVGGLIEEVVAGLPARPPAIRIEVRVVRDVIVDGNRALLGDALHSLLENGCEAMVRGGLLAVELAKLGDGRARIGITDTGTGIARRYQDSLFKPGFSTKGRRDRRRPRGRGLFTCREIIRKHGGDIRIESDEGQGTAVTIFLPILGA
jgi:signal transduction histidine kinase